MRIWSIHPKYLDTKGLVALWREALLAKHVLENKTKGYRNHPQLERFKKSGKPVIAINQYLSIVYKEAIDRGFNFDINKFKRVNCLLSLTVNEGQLGYEFEHLLNKLKIRDVELHRKLRKIKIVESHPLFKVIKGKIESWEHEQDN
jgi:hypothetical protein